MASQGSFLIAPNTLVQNDYLVSPSGLFFCLMQTDGNLVVYRGAGPQDQNTYGPALWSTATGAQPTGDYFLQLTNQATLSLWTGTPDAPGSQYWNGQPDPNSAGNYFLSMQDDGNLVLYPGTDPSNQQGGSLWSSHYMDPIVSVVSVQSLTYDLSAGQILQTQPDDIYSITVPNPTDATQNPTFSKTETVEETAGWSDSLTLAAGITASYSAQIPFIMKGKIEVSLSVTNNYTWNGSETISKSWSFTAPVKVPPHETIKLTVSVRVSQISVPYTLQALFQLQSGYQVPGTVSGVYSGTTSHDLQMEYQQVNPSNGTPIGPPTIQPLEATFKMAKEEATAAA
jgi:Clostridium epsilon toxin ETX/Bacillus mosquitocidal toxin MTX2